MACFYVYVAGVRVSTVNGRLPTPMAANPIYDTGPVYDTIPEPPSARSQKVHQQHPTTSLFSNNSRLGIHHAVFGYINNISDAS